MEPRGTLELGQWVHVRTPVPGVYGKVADLWGYAAAGQPSEVRVIYPRQDSRGVWWLSNWATLAGDVTPAEPPEEWVYRWSLAELSG